MRKEKVQGIWQTGRQDFMEKSPEVRLPWVEVCIRDEEVETAIRAILLRSLHGKRRREMEGFRKHQEKAWRGVRNEDSGLRKI